ncbi:MAG: NAD(P)/FAD-dependent oxidoreductase [Clostridiales bacterium]|nr:NAD(P)/FAD-dependent oxidoreductase [Clostridiales bacterium]
MKRIVIIGGGASGLIGAIHAARMGAQVTILEQNEKLGKKILATGNGRCNLTNLHQEASCYQSSQPEYPWSVIRQFPLSDTLHFFSTLGICTRERNGWLYPYSDQAASVAEALELEARHRKVKIKTREEVTDIKILPEGFQVLTKTWHYECDRVLICCGGKASSVEGSSDFGYHLAKKLGHTVIEPMPALAALKGSSNYFGKWAGSRMDGTIRLDIAGESARTERGEILFTDYGISGIAVFQLSRYAIRAAREGRRVTCHLDLMPDVSKEELLSLLEKRQDDCPYKSVQELLIGLLPKKMISVLAPAKADLDTVAANLKDWAVPIRDAYSLKQAQICSGGVDTKELTDHLESRIHPGIFFAGEVVDADGPCGGYNLQWAWSSGTVAGQSAARS